MKKRKSTKHIETASPADSAEITKRDPSATGIELRGIWLNECTFEDFGFNKFVGEGKQVEASEGDDMEVTPEAEVWFNADREAMVRLSVELRPTSQPSFRARVAYVAHYVANKDSVLPLNEFAWSNGLAYLIPFVREKLATITQSSFYPTFYLQPFNVDALTEDESEAVAP